MRRLLGPDTEPCYDSGVFRREARLAMLDVVAVVIGIALALIGPPIFHFLTGHSKPTSRASEPDYSARN